MDAHSSIKAHDYPWMSTQKSLILGTECFKIEDYCGLIHGWSWALMDECASICRFLSMDKNPAIGGYSANIHVWLDKNPSSFKQWIHARLDISPSLITVNPVKTFLQCSSIEVVQLKFLMQLDKMKITSFDVAQVWF